MNVLLTDHSCATSLQEDAAYRQYTEALRLQAAGDDDGADELFRAVLDSPAVADSAEPDPSGG